MRQLAILYLLTNFSLINFGQININPVIENSASKNDSTSNPMSYYSKLKLIDRFDNALQKDTATRIVKAQFSPIFIGDKKTEITITYNASKVGNRTGKWVNYKIPDSNSMIIFIDTTKSVGSPMGVWEYLNKADYRKDKIAYPVFIENISIDTLEIGFGDILPIIMEAKDENGIWKPIQKKFIYGCGKGLTEFFLAPKQIAITTMKQFEGTFKTKLRLVYSYTTLKIYSNEINGYINKGQFE